MITIKDAVNAALRFARQLYDKEEMEELRVEEIESSEDGKKWLVTLGWVEQAVRQIGGFAGLTNASIEPLPRVYKVFVFIRSLPLMRRPETSSP